ncbi:MAG: FAD binding domain-containing protein [Acidimicrobiales bacterium]|nr:FAD binding domain-containing protein [Acidimicrobiales bacterium]
MKPPPFEYLDPATLDEALDLLAEAPDDSAVIAGGQSLVPLLNLRLARPERVVDPRRIERFHELRVDHTGVHAGALVTAGDLERHPACRDVSGLAEALALIGHPQIRNRTTVGGSIAHADPAAELPALLLATDGSVTLHSRALGERVVAASALFEGPFTTCRRSDELLTSVTIPAVAGRVTVLEVAARPGDFATVGVVVGALLDDGTVAEARIVAFGVAGTPIRLSGVEQQLIGAPAEHAPDLASTAVREQLDAAGDEHTSADYRRHVAGTLVARALRQLCATDDQAPSEVAP